MLAISSSDFLKEFTLYANKTWNEKEILIVQRQNSKNIVAMSMEEYNELKKEIYLLKEELRKHK